MTSPRIVWCLGGLDPSAAAGLFLDLRVLGEHGVLGRGIVTVTTAQADDVWLGARPLSPEWLSAQHEALTQKERPDAVKVGALGDESTTRRAADILRTHAAVPLVLDPISRSSSGGRLGPDVSVLREHLLPLATVLTPNVPEAEALLGRSIRTPEEQFQAAHALRAFGPRHVLLKGGHLPTGPHDVWVDETGRARGFEHPRLPFTVRGTGCALASALAARLARGEPPRHAVPSTITWLQRAMREATPRQAPVRHLLAPPHEPPA